MASLKFVPGNKTSVKLYFIGRKLVSYKCSEHLGWCGGDYYYLAMNYGI
jgi:hypothetical protein